MNLQSISSSQQRLNGGVANRLRAHFHNLTQSERFVFVCVACFPLFWLIGLLYYLPLLLLFSVLLYEFWQTGGIRWQFPSLSVLGLLAFGIYQLFLLYLGGADSSGLFRVVILSLCPAGWLWYVMTRKITVRLDVICWAGCVLLLQLLLVWILTQFILPHSLFEPPRIRNLFALLTGRGGSTADRFINPFFLIPYVPYGQFAGNLYRYIGFFHYPELLALISGVFGVLALDLRERNGWKLILLLGWVFMAFLSATRTVCIALPLVAASWYCINQRRHTWVVPLCLGGLALLSFITLAIPFTHEWFISSLSNSASAINDLREQSSDLRYEIYHQTWNAFLNNPIWGYGERGDSVHEHLAIAALGSHSFWLGTLLYQTGLVGTSLFLIFWCGLIHYLIQTRQSRPLSAFGVLFLYFIVSPMMAQVYQSSLSFFLILLAIVAYQPPKANSIHSTY